MIGRRYGDWIVAAIHPGQWPWAWLVHAENPQVQARISVHSLEALT